MHTSISSTLCEEPTVEVNDTGEINVIGEAGVLVVWFPGEIVDID